MLTVVVLVGTTMGASAGETYSDYREYFDEKPVAIDRAKQKNSRTRLHPADGIDTRRYDDGSASKNPDALKPGYRNSAGFYVPPDYSTHPRSPTDFEGSSSEVNGGLGAPRPFGGLGTRR